MMVVVILTPAKAGGRITWFILVAKKEFGWKDPSSQKTLLRMMVWTRPFNNGVKSARMRLEISFNNRSEP
jgi:hypothetical protein